MPTLAWRDDGMMMCPSQRWAALEINGSWYRLYLRWRHDDPWTAEWSCCPTKKDAENLFGKETHGGHLIIEYYTHDEYLAAQNAVIKEIIKLRI